MTSSLIQDADAVNRAGRSTAPDLPRNQYRSTQSGTQKSFYVYDGHGSVRALTDGSGNVTDTYDYDAFGNVTHQTGTTPNEFLFAGEQYDSNLHLYYNRARYLNTSTGRFWSMDTFEPDDWEPTSLHRYLYAGNDPVNRIDPSGHDFDLGSLGASAAISGTIDAISAISERQTLGGVAKAFVLGSLKGAAFFLAGGIAFKLLGQLGAAASSLEAVQTAQEFLSNVLQRAGPLYEGLQLPTFFSINTNVGEIWITQNATEHLQELLSGAENIGSTKLAAALVIAEAKTAIENVAGQGFDAVAGQKLTTQVGDYVVEIVIEPQPSWKGPVPWAVTHLLFRH